MSKRKSNATSFKPGRKKTGGRKPGSPNKITVAVKDAIAIAADRIGGVNRLVRWIKQSPRNERLFWTQMYTRLLPLQINTKVERTDTAVYKSVEEFRVALIERGMPEENIKSLLQLPGPQNQTRQ
jgi:precorrin-3B methylase